LERSSRLSTEKSGNRPRAGFLNFRRSFALNCTLAKGTDATELAQSHTVPRRAVHRITSLTSTEARPATRDEYHNTFEKWKNWAEGVPIEKLGRDETREFLDLRETCATLHDEHVPESSIETLGHSVGGITDRHCAHCAPLAFRAITTIPQSTALLALIKGHDGECPCCRRRFADACEPGRSDRRIESTESNGVSCCLVQAFTSLPTRSRPE
jgi:hypothetical protein